MSERTNLRQRIVHTTVSTAGTGGNQNIDITVPDGMLMEVHKVHVQHTDSSNVTVTIETIDENGTVIIVFSSQSISSSECVSAPANGAAASYVKSRVTQWGPVVLIPARHALRVATSAIGTDKFSYIYLDYALKPYTFTHEEAT